MINVATNPPASATNAVSSDNGVYEAYEVVVPLVEVEHCDGSCV